MTDHELTLEITNAFDCSTHATASQTFEAIRSSVLMGDFPENMRAIGSNLASFVKFYDYLEVRASGCHLYIGMAITTLDGQYNRKGQPLRKWERLRFVPWLPHIFALTGPQRIAIRDFFEWFAIKEHHQPDDDDEISTCLWFWNSLANEAQ